MNGTWSRDTLKYQDSPLLLSGKQRRPSGTKTHNLLLLRGEATPSHGSNYCSATDIDSHIPVDP